MIYSKMRGVVVAGVLSAVLFASPPESKALFDWLWPANQCASPIATTYAMPYAANRVSWTPSYGVTSTCNPLLASSCGYGVHRVAAVQPAVSACNPCGSAVTATYRTTYRPFWSWWAARPRLFGRPTYQTVSYTPYVTYPPASTTSCYPSSSTTCGPSLCNPCGGIGSVCGSVGSSCATGSCDPVVSGTTVPSLGTTPTWNGGPSPIEGGGGTSTFRHENGSEPSQGLQPTPDASTEPATTNPPMLINPKSQTAAKPLRLATFWRPVSAPAQTPARPSIDVGGWRASRD